MSKKKPTRCPDSIDIEELIAAHNMRETQEALDRQQYEKEWLEQLELYSKKPVRTFELHVENPNKFWWVQPLKEMGNGALWAMATVGIITVARMIYHILVAINA